jgi:uncharacterized protein DUF4845
VPARASSSGICIGLRRRHAQSGAGRLKAIVWLIILVVMIYVGAKVVPVLVNEYELTDGMQNIARFATVNRQTPAQIQDAVLKEAEKDDVPLTLEDVKAQSINGNVKIEADYAVTVDLGVYQWIMNFHPTSSNNALF